MIQRKRRALVLKRASDYGNLSSPRRMEILSSLSDEGPASVQELSVRLGVSVHSLYFHLRALEAAGAIVPRVEKGKRKPLARYRMVGSRIGIDPDPRDPAAMSAAEKAVHAMMRFSARELVDALKGNARRAGRLREVWGVRIKGRISRETLRLVNKHLVAIEKILRKGGRGRAHSSKVYALTLVLSPGE